MFKFFKKLYLVLMRRQKYSTENITPRSPEEPTKRTIKPIINDDPIKKSEEDSLARTGIAVSFAEQVLSLEASEGLVVGVLGAWGSGKTSFINLARSRLKQDGAIILDFNPWMFSGAEQLVESFFIELAAQLKLRQDLSEVGQYFEEYGESFSGMAWLPFLGPWLDGIGGVSKILGRILQRKKEGIGGRREKLENALIGLDKPIIVILDDIDRLSTSEIRDIFKLVRLTASFPNIIYIVAFDRKRVEDALAEQRIPGRDYLEKILQVAVDLPAIPDQVLIQQIFSAIDNALTGIENPGKFDEHEWPDIFMEIIRPLIRNMRDVRRYAASVRGTVLILNGQVALADLLGMEAIRIFLPDVFEYLPHSVEALTQTAGSSRYEYRENPLKAQIDKLIETAGRHSLVLKSMIERLFPAAQRHLNGTLYGSEWKNGWLKERRIGHEDLLRLYLERIAGENLLAFTEAERVWVHMDNHDTFNDRLRSIDRKQLRHVIASLEAYEDQFKPEHVEPGVVALSNLMPDIPEETKGMFDFGPRTTISRVVYRLLRALKEPSAVEAATQEILPQIETLSAKLEVIRIIGHHEGAGHKLVSVEAAAEIEKQWRQTVRSTLTGNILIDKEYDLLRVLLVTRKTADPSEPPLEIPDSPEFTLALLSSARSEATSQPMGSRSVRRSPRLAWESLIAIFGDEAILKVRIDALKATQPDNAGDLLELADKYLGGWRPNGFD